MKYCSGPNFIGKNVQFNNFYAISFNTYDFIAYTCASKISSSKLFCIENIATSHFFKKFFDKFVKYDHFLYVFDKNEIHSVCEFLFKRFS